MWRHMILLLLWAAGATGANAGAWPRDEGAVFLSFGGNVALFGEAVRPVYYDPTVYLEYGLTERLTLGFDGYTADAGTAGAAFAFARHPIGPADRAHKFAASLGYGLILIPTGATETAARAGLHWGYGLQAGWLAVDGTLIQSVPDPRLQSKVEATWGHRFDDRWTSILQMQAGTGLEGDFYAKVSPSILYSVTDSIDIRLGLVQALTGDQGGGLTLETWVRF